MDKTTEIATVAERLFDREGYVATGMDRLTEAAGLSSRTLYKHVGSKARLMGRVLAERDRRFMARMQVGSVDALFSALEDWVHSEGARGCLFLRAAAETGANVPEIADALSAHKTAFKSQVDRIVAHDLGREDQLLAEQVLVLFEGATHAAVYRGAESVSAARAAAVVLTALARA